MVDLTPFDPGAVYAPQGMNDADLPGVFISPQRYVQGAGVLERSGRYLSLMGVKRGGVLASTRGFGADAGRLIGSLASEGIATVQAVFGGECSTDEITARVADFQSEKVDCLLAVGGGKCVDAGKAIAWRLGVPVVIVPTLASNDAPCSALSVLYTPQGMTDGIEFYPDSPALVVVDTDVVANASERYLVAGMGDAMATWYEARVCLDNPRGRTPLGARPTLASCALGEICAKTLYEQGERAVKAVHAGAVDEALEQVVEANTLLSGIGFESGGIAAAHSVAQSYPAIERVHANYLHGEMVAMGLLTQLMMNGGEDEVLKAATFFTRVGLPVHLGQLSLDSRGSEIELVAELSVQFPLMHNMPFEVTPAVVRDGIIAAHELGAATARKEGDEAYRRLQSE